MRKLLLATGCLLMTMHCICQSWSNERIYVQTNKTAFLPGESVWLKAYIINKFSPDDIFTTLFIDLVDAKGTVIATRKQVILDGAATATIDLPANLPEGVLELRAYPKKTGTQHTGNFFGKKIYVLSPYKNNYQALRTGNTFNCRLYTPQGKLVAGLVNTVSFKATDESGQAVNIRGTLLNAKNEPVLSFKDAYYGIGRFAFTPDKNETYTVVINFPGNKTKSFPLPAVTEDGVIIDVVSGADTKIFTVHIPDKKKGTGQAMIYGSVDNTIVFQKAFSLANSSFSAAIPVRELPASMMKLVVTDANKQPIASTATFINNESSFLAITLTTDTLHLSAKAKNVFSISVPDSILGNCSISVTDYDKEVHFSQTNIMSALLVTQEKNCRTTLFDQPVQHELPDSLIDMILATSDCEDLSIKNTRPEVETIADSDFITIKGKAFYKKGNKPVTKGELNIIFSTMDSNTTVMPPVPLQNDGSFLVTKMVYYGTGTYRYKLNGKGNEDIFVQIDSTTATGSNQLPPLVPETFLFDPSLFGEASVTNVTSQSSQLNTDTSKLTLASVTVTASKSALTQQVNNRYTRGLFQNSATAKVLDLINDPPGNIAGNIFDYLQNEIPGLMITRVGTEYVFRSLRAFSMSSGFAPIKIYLNENEMPSGALVGIPIQEFALVKYFPPGNSQLPGVGVAGVLAIYTKKPVDAPSSAAALSKFTVAGYSVFKDFTTDYLEKENPAVINGRSTIYWAPSFFLNGGQKTYAFSFTNSALAKRLHVVIEGFTVDGKLIHVDKVIE